MIQPLFITLLITVLSVASLLNLEADHPIFVTDPAPVSLEVFSDEYLYTSNDSILLTHRHESPRLNHPRLLPDRSEKIVDGNSPIIYAVSFGGILLSWSLYFNLITQRFIRKTLQFLNLYSRFAHA